MQLVRDSKRRKRSYGSFSECDDGSDKPNLAKQYFVDKAVFILERIDQKWPQT
jgi:hypothetical protein